MHHVFRSPNQSTKQKSQSTKHINAIFQYNAKLVGLEVVQITKFQSVKLEVDGFDAAIS